MKTISNNEQMTCNYIAKLPSHSADRKKFLTSWASCSKFQFYLNFDSMFFSCITGKITPTKIPTLYLTKNVNFTNFVRTSPLTRSKILHSGKFWKDKKTNKESNYRNCDLFFLRKVTIYYFKLHSSTVMCRKYIRSFHGHSNYATRYLNIQTGKKYLFCPAKIWDLLHKKILIPYFWCQDL